MLQGSKSSLDTHWSQFGKIRKRGGDSQCTSYTGGTGWEGHGGRGPPLLQIHGERDQTPMSVSHVLNMCSAPLAAPLFLSYKVSSEKKVTGWQFQFHQNLLCFLSWRRMTLNCSLCPVLCIQPYTVPSQGQILPSGSCKHTTLLISEGSES